MTARTQPRAPGCLDAESLAAFVDGQVNPDDRSAMEAHLGSCETCTEALAEVIHTLEAVQERSETVSARRAPIVAATSRWNRRFLAMLATAAALAVLAGTWWWRRPTPVEAALAALAEAPRDARLSIGRLSIDREWKPVTPLLRQAGPEINSLDVRSAALAITALTETDVSAEALHARGLALLANGDLDGSVDALARAANANGGDGAVARSDLSAARLEQFRRTGNRDHAQRALDDAEVALRFNPSAPTALFNRAAALDALGEGEKATVAWQTYLNVDSSSAWSAEVRRRLAR